MRTSYPMKTLWSGAFFNCMALQISKGISVMRCYSYSFNIILLTAHQKKELELTRYCIKKLSNLAAFHEVLVAVRLHRPQNEARHIDEVAQSENREAWKSYKKPEKSPPIKLGRALLKNFYEAPLSSGPKNSMWLERSQALRGALETF